MASGDALMAARKKKPNFIAGAIKHPGALHSQLGVPQGQKIPGGKMAAAASGADGPLAKKRALFARTLSGLGK